ncbi:MAG TPA: acyl-CoA dehydrogenase family protein [Pseudonocardia sp.]|nr:acyl-CoA dehydrogenase family protein [Pseudonocardia sp.]
MNATRTATELLHLPTYRAAVGEWLTENSSRLDRWRVHHETVEQTVAEHAELVAVLYEAGWNRYGWPELSGGLGGDERHRAVLYDELVLRGLPIPEQHLPLETLAPPLLRFAPTLAATYLPRLLAGREWWGQGFSEPEAGSDLASLRSRARRDGDRYVVNGQKIWTSHGATATRLVVLLRTGTPESRHRGLGMFLIDADAPGVTVRPLALASGRNELAEIFFDDVVVPADRLIGEEDGGWAVAMYLLQWERAMFAWQCSTALLHRLGGLRDALAGAAAVPDGAAAELARRYLDVLTLRARTARTVRRLAAGETVGPEASVDKILLATAEHGVYDAIRDLRAPAMAVGLAGPAGPDPGMTGLRAEWWYSRSATILGGSAEVQRGILADRILNLPKE